MPCWWSLLSWCTLRMSVTLSMNCACSGNDSQMNVPGTLVAIGLNGPRISAGAAGFGSICFKVTCSAVQPILDNRRVGFRLAFRRCHCACLQNRRQRQAPQTGTQKSTSIKKLAIATACGCCHSFPDENCLGTYEMDIAKIQSDVVNFAKR